MMTMEELRASKEMTPVDAEFESITRQLLRCARLLKEHPQEIENQKAFCQTLRECKVIFEKVVDSYGSRYRNGQGGAALLEIAQEAFDNCNFGELTRSSVARHINHIASLQMSTFGTRSESAHPRLDYP